MHLNTLKAFRHGVYASLRKANDALFNLVDALLSEDRARSFPELSLSPHFERKWSSLYASLKDGVIDQEQLRSVFVTYRPQPKDGNDLWIAIDASGIARPKAVTSPDRSAQPVHNLPKCEKPITYGWQFSTVVVLPPTPSSWTYTLDQRCSHGTWWIIQAASANPLWAGFLFFGSPVRPPHPGVSLHPSASAGTFIHLPAT